MAPDPDPTSLTPSATNPTAPPPPQPTQQNTNKEADDEEEDPSLFSDPLFSDPPDYYPPTPPPTTQSYTLPSTGATITLHLVGASPLDAHKLWNGSRVVAGLFEAEPARVRGKNVLELGAGAGLPSLVATVLGAKRVVVTDFPDPELVEVLWKNVWGCRDQGLFPGVVERGEGAEGGGKGDDGEEKKDQKLPIVAEGYVWGADPTKILGHLPADERAAGFDVLILADLLFRHSEHGAMLRTIRTTLKKSRDSKAYVVFTSYRPWLQQRDLGFFDLAREQGFVVDKLLEKKMDKPLFENDPGDKEVMRTVTGWVVRWPDEVCVAVGSQGRLVGEEQR